MKTIPPSPHELARQHEQSILAAVTNQYGFPAGELKLLADETGDVKEEPGAYCFIVQHASGWYGVYAKPDTQGTLTEFIATEI